MVEQPIAGLRRDAAVEVEAEEPGEREFLAPALLIERALALEVEGALDIGQCLPFGLGLLVSGDGSAALVIVPLAEPGQDLIVQTPQSLDTTHRRDGLLVHSTRPVFLSADSVCEDQAGERQCAEGKPCHLPCTPPRKCQVSLHTL